MPSANDPDPRGEQSIMTRTNPVQKKMRLRLLQKNRLRAANRKKARSQPMHPKFTYLPEVQSVDKPTLTVPRKEEKGMTMNQ